MSTLFFRALRRALFVVSLLLPLQAAATLTFTLTAPPWNSVTDFPGPCTVGNCANFPPGSAVSGSFSTSLNVLPPNTTVNLDATVFRYEVNDGVQTYSSADPLVRLRLIQVATDGAGTPIGFEFIVLRWFEPPPHAAGARYASYFTRSANNVSFAVRNQICDQVLADGGCGQNSADNNTSRADGPIPVLAAAPNPPPPPPPPPQGNTAGVPTLSEWATLALVLLLAFLGARHGVLRRRD